MVIEKDPMDEGGVSVVFRFSEGHMQLAGKEGPLTAVAWAGVVKIKAVLRSRKEAALEVERLNQIAPPSVLYVALRAPFVEA